MYTIEYIAPFLLAIFFAFSFIFNRRVVWIACGFLSVGQVVILAFRSEDYNSDTFNYSKYLAYIIDADGLGIFAASKFEPLHLGIALIANDFRVWMILEAILCSFFLVEIIRRLQSLESIAVVLGSAVPLFSSSMRFSVGLLAIAYAMLAFPRVKGSSILITTIGLMTHISLVAFAFFQRGKLWQVIILVMSLMLYAGSDVAFVERAGGGEDNSAGGSGLRAFLTLLIFLLFVYFRGGEYKISSFLKDVVIALILLYSTNFIFPVFNRFLVLLLIIKAIQFDYFGVNITVRNRFLHGLAALVLYLLLVIPHVISMNNKVAVGDW